MEFRRCPRPTFLLVDSSAVTLAVIFDASTLYRTAVRMRFTSFDNISVEPYPGQNRSGTREHVTKNRLRSAFVIARIRTSASFSWSTEFPPQDDLVFFSSHP